VDYYIGEESASPVIVERSESYFKIGTKNVGDVEIDRSNVVGRGAYGYSLLLTCNLIGGTKSVRDVMESSSLEPSKAKKWQSSEYNSLALVAAKKI
jgi:hypothetical protein